MNICVVRESFPCSERHETSLVGFFDRIIQHSLSFPFRSNFRIGMDSKLCHKTIDHAKEAGGLKEILVDHLFKAGSTEGSPFRVNFEHDFAGLTRGDVYGELGEPR